MQTIKTKYLPATNTKPSRIRARASGGASLVMSVSNQEEGGDYTHVDVALALKRKLKWEGKMYGGDTKEGMVFVFDSGPVIE